MYVGSPNQATGGAGRPKERRRSLSNDIPVSRQPHSYYVPTDLPMHLLLLGRNRNDMDSSASAGRQLCANLASAPQTKPVLSTELSLSQPVIESV